MSRTSRSSVLARVCVAAVATVVMACSTVVAGPLPTVSSSPHARTSSTVAAVATAPTSTSPTAPATHDHTATPADTSPPAPTAASATSVPTQSASAVPQAATTAPAVASGPIAVTLLDVAIKLDRPATAAGSVTFSIKNAGTVIHQLVVLKTDIAQNQIPPNPTQPGTMAEPGFVAQTPLLNPGGSFTLTLTLASGNYVLMCNQPAHYLIGMHTGFIVN